jgi:hypothetical protein
MSLTSPNYTPRPNIGHYVDEHAALDAVVARLVAELDPQAIRLFSGKTRSHPSPLWGGMPFALASGREGALPFPTVNPLPADLWSSTFPARGKDKCQDFAAH